MEFYTGIFQVRLVMEQMKKKKKVRKSKEEIKVNVLKLVELVKEQHIKSGFPKLGM